MNLRAALRFLGRLLMVLAAAELFPVVCCLVYGEFSAALAFLGTAVLTGLCGLPLLGLEQRGELYRREGILIVVGGWVLASVFGALPYLFTGTLDCPMDALFESASGFTTTGASVIADIEGCGRGILFWRSFTQWLGGMGIIVLFVALLPELGPGARFLYKLEVPGPTAEALRPRVHDTAAALWKIYLLLSGIQVFLLMLAGLDLYNALTHTFSTMSTGGFSPLGDSAMSFSPLVQVIIVVFMLIAGVNFSLYYSLRRYRGRNLVTDPEFRIYAGVTLAASLAITWNLMSEGRRDLPQAFLDSLFQVASILTTTGFASVDFNQWSNFACGVLVALMFLGGCAGSTAGGPKVMRMVIGLKTAFREVRLIFSPSTVLAVFVGGKVVPGSVVRSVSSFFILYMTCWGTGTLLLSIGTTDLETAATASIATLGNIGPGLSGVGPTANFAGFAAWQKMLMVVLMWLGRLEVYAIAAVVTVAFWRR
jgi:trk system potassium uptake protein TrkH